MDVLNSCFDFASMSLSQRRVEVSSVSISREGIVSIPKIGGQSPCCTSTIRSLLVLSWSGYSTLSILWSGSTRLAEFRIALLVKMSPS